MPTIEAERKSYNAGVLCECGHIVTKHARRGLGEKNRHSGECTHFDQKTRKFCRCQTYRPANEAPSGLGKI